jgi:hypothetical protein
MRFALSAFMRQLGFAARGAIPAAVIILIGLTAATRAQQAVPPGSPSALAFAGYEPQCPNDGYDSCVSYTYSFGTVASFQYSNIAGSWGAGAFSYTSGNSGAAESDGHANTNVWITSFADASYTVAMEQIAPTPQPVIGVPVDISGSAKTKVSADSNSAQAWAEVDVNYVSAIGALVKKSYPVNSYCSAGPDGELCGSDGQEAVSFNIAALILPNTSVFINISAQGTEFEGGSWSATADPTLIIDPSFPYKDDFELLFPPGFSATPSVPEPSSVVLIALGGLALISLRLRPLAVFRNPGAARRASKQFAVG